MARRGAGRRGDQRVRHGRRQGRRADGLPRVGAVARSRPTTRRPAARGATASPPAPAVRHRARQGPARLLHRALGGRRGPAEARRRARSCDAAEGDAAALRRAPQRARARRRRGGGGPRDRRPPRPRGRDPAGAVGAGPASPAGSSARGTRTRSRSAGSAAQEGTRVRWRQYRSVWAWVEGDGCRRDGHPAPLRRPLASPRPPVPCCDVCDPGARPGRAGGAAAPARARHRPADLDGAILDVVARAAAAASAARARSRSCAAGARR